MKWSLSCRPLSKSPHATPLVFDWDDETGEVSGPSAPEIRQIAEWGVVSLHPLPQSHKLSQDPLRSRADMAAIIGEYHELPEALAADYPAGQTADEDPYIRDLDGHVIDEVVY